MENITETESITGQFQRILMRDYKSGYTVFTVLTPSGPVTCRGNILLPKEGMKLEITGCWEETKYGRQLSKCTVQVMYSDRDSMMEYLCTIPGIGTKTAADLVETFGENLYSIALSPDAISKLRQIPSVSQKRAESIIEYILETQEERKLFEMVSKNGGSYNASLKIYKDHGTYSIERLTARPYEIGIKAGLSFEVCDRIAQSHGFPAFAKPRVKAALMNVLWKKSKTGDTYVPQNELIKATRDMLAGTTNEAIAYNESIAAAVINACLATINEGIVREQKDVYLNTLYYQELRTAYAVKRLIRDAIPTECDPDALCSYAEEVCGVTYAAQQREAFTFLKKGGICILTGGPGTGKTTVIKGLLAGYEKLYPDNTIRLCAPTGRASQRMAEATGREATTIHRLLEYRPFGDTTICKNETDPIDANLLVIDEGSMISIDIADLLFSAIRSGTMVIIAGDVEQLPSVNAGNVLHDLINSKIIPVVALTETHRQANGSLIIENAQRIRNGQDLLATGEDFTIIECASDSEIPEIVTREYQKYHDPDNVFAAQVLTPSRKREHVGSKALNNNIQNLINPGKDGLRYADAVFRLQDKVMMMRNNYDPDNCYFNGDVGIITSVENSGLTIRLDQGDIHLTEDVLDDVSLAYVSTIHKSQGSEYDTVIVALSSEPATMLQRNLLYTAITRAKKRVILIATKGAVSKAVHTKDAAKRKSHLDTRLNSDTRKVG